MPKVKFITFGCKVNQYETQAMRERLERAGMESVQRTGGSRSSEADFVVINTCSVTEEADREGRYWIRRSRREYPNARIVVTGCGVERDREKVQALPEVDFVLSNDEKDQIARHLIGGRNSPAIPEQNPRHRYRELSISKTEGRGRAFVKIQDGCNHACSFCKVVMVRGRSRSRSLKEIVLEVLRLRDQGYREIVFAGIQLGAYGLDFETSPSLGLAEVLEACSQIEGIERLRLSSIEPTDVKPSLIEAFAEIPKCVPHLHIPLQSGDDEILARMNRRYNRSFYLDLISQLRSALPDFCLTLDVMAGFPGEEETHFQNTLDLLEEVQPLKCHVFPYSRRQGTRAAHWQEVPSEVVRERVRRLLDLEKRLGREVRLSYRAKTMPVLVEAARDKDQMNSTSNVLLQGLTANYLKVAFYGEADWVERIIPVELVLLHDDTFLGVYRAE